MTQTKTKKALLMSVLSMVLCVAMLVGMTFAWFTDTASTGVNKIVAGNLKVGLEYNDNGEWKDATKTELQFKVNGKIPAEGTQILWEPGCRYELPELRVVNNGNLALKYKIAITGIEGDAKLNEVIDWTIDDEPINLTEKKLAANTKDNGFVIKGHMQETANNDYQNLSIGGIAITVYATQDTVEADSYNNQYDAKAQYPVEASASVEAKTDDEGNTTVAKEVKIKSAATVKVSETETRHMAVATVPAETKLVNTETKKLKLIINETDEPDGFTVETGTEVDTFDVSIEGIADDNTTPIEVELYVGTGLANVKLYHKGTAMDVASYSYNAETGFITFKSATFSPFTVTYELPPMSANGTAYDSLEEAIVGANGAKIVLNSDIKTRSGYKFSGDINIDLNGHTWTLDNNTGINNTCNLTVSNGKILGKGSSSYIDIRVGADKKATIKFTDVDFENTYKLGSKAGGSSTTYTDYILKYSPSEGSENLDISFTDCTFKNAAIKMNGYSKGGNVKGVLDNCKFDALTNSSLIARDYVTEGMISIKDCDFNVIITSNVKVIDCGKVDINVEGTNTFDGRVATDADRATGSEYPVILYQTQSATAGVSGENVALKGVFAK